MNSFEIPNESEDIRWWQLRNCFEIWKNLETSWPDDVDTIKQIFKIWTKWPRSRDWSWDRRKHVCPSSNSHLHIFLKNLLSPSSIFRFTISWILKNPAYIYMNHIIWYRHINQDQRRNFSAEVKVKGNVILYFLGILIFLSQSYLLWKPINYDTFDNRATYQKYSWKFRKMILINDKKFDLCFEKIQKLQKFTRNWTLRIF